MLVVGPNRLFLGYIEQVLPSLGEAGVELAVLADLLTDPPTIRGYDAPRRPPASRATCAWPTCSPRPSATARRPLRDDLVGRLRRRRSCGCRRRRPSGSSPTPGAGPAPTTPAASSSRPGLFEALAASARARGRRRPRSATACATTRRCARRSSGCGRCSPRPQLLHDLFGSKPLLRLAGRRRSSPRPRSTRSTGPRSDVARRRRLHQRRRAPARRGPGAARRPAPAPAQRPQRPSHDDEVRTYGHIIVDEAQDLSPMQLRMLARRSLNGSMTIVGDIAQATGAWAHADWERDPRAAPDRAPRAPPGRAHHRLPDPGAEHGAGRAGARASPRPTCSRPRSVREDGDPPRIVARRRRTRRSAPGGRRRRRRRARRRRARQRRRDLPVVAGRAARRRPRGGRASSSASPPAPASTSRSPSCPSGW